MAYTFEDLDSGKNIEFDNASELVLDTNEDISSHKISAYIVEYNGVRYRVDENTYTSIKEEKGI